MSENQELTHQERLQEYDEAFTVRKAFDRRRYELLDVALGVYTGHAASADSQTTMRNALQKAQELIRLVDEKAGSRPDVPPYPKEY